MKNFLIGLAQLFILFNCAKPQSSTQDVNCIPISFNDAKTINFPDIFHLENVIPLETKEESLIEKTSKIEIRNNRFYLFNTRMNDPIFKEIMQFDSTGRFLTKMTSVESAVSDFRYATDFVIEDNKILFLEGVVKRLLISENNKINKTISLDTDGSKFIKQGNKFWIYRDNQFGYSSVEDQNSKNSNLVVLDKNGETEEFFLPIPKTIKDLHIATSNVFYQDTSADLVYFFPTLSDTVYEFSSKIDLVSKFCIQENEDLKVNVPDRFNSNDKREILQFLNTPSTCTDKYVFTNDNQLIFLLSTPKNLFIARYQKQDNNLTTFVLDEQGIPGLKCTWDGAFLYMLIHDPINNEMLASLNTDGMEKISLNSNPVILKLKFN